jgi:hypothetical protein
VANLKIVAPPDSPEDVCQSPDPVVTPFCSQLKLDKNKAASKFTKAKAAATLDFHTALETWTQAVSQHEFDVATAKATVDAAAAEAGKAFEDKKNLDSLSRNLFRYYRMREAIASAVQAYETSIATAASALAVEAGNLLAAHAGYIAALNAAQATQLAEETAAEQTFWQSVETARDTV